MNNRTLYYMTVAVIFVLFISLFVMYNYSINNFHPTELLAMLFGCFRKPLTYSEAWRGTNRSLTVVTAYFDIGKIPKGAMYAFRTPKTYEFWMSVFTFMENPVVFYTDSTHFAAVFQNLRKTSAAPTQIIVIKRTDLWPFKIIPKIKKIYSRPRYPRHYPNTVVPEYTSLSHSKQPLLADTVVRMPFNTQYYCWVDVGYFRNIVNRKIKFFLEVPSDFNKSRVAVTQIFHRDLSRTLAKNIIYHNINWIGGGLFLGVPSVILKFHDQYKRTVFRYLRQGLMNAEQHILYAMYTASERLKYPLQIDVQTYIPGYKRVIDGDPWFYLGFVMYHENITSF